MLRTLRSASCPSCFWVRWPPVRHKLQRHIRVNIKKFWTRFDIDLELASLCQFYRPLLSAIEQEHGSQAKPIGRARRG